MHTFEELAGWLGRRVRDGHGEEVGIVAAVLGDEETGTPEWLVVDLVPGPGRRAVPVVGSVAAGAAVRVPHEAARVRASPPLAGAAHLPVGEEAAVSAHYGLAHDRAASGTGLPRRADVRPNGDRPEPRAGGRPSAPSQDAYDEVVAALRRAHAMEELGAAEMSATITAARDEVLVHDLTLHRAQTGRHAARIAERLRELGASPSSWRDLAARLTGKLAGRAPVLAPATAEAQLAAAETLEAREIAAYEDLVALARRAGDARTAEICADILADERAMRDTLAGNRSRAAEMDAGRFTAPPGLTAQSPRT